MNALQQVEDNLRYIRHTLEEAGTFTNISAVGLLLVGLIGLAAAAFTVWRIGLPSHWTPAGFQTFLLAWTAAACLAAPTAAISMLRRARQSGVPLWVGPSRRALRAMLPAWIAGGLLTAACLTQGGWNLIAPLWLALEALAMLSAASFSIPPVRWMGWSLLLLAVAAVVWPSPAAALLALGLGFGGVHIVAGIYLWRHDAAIA